MWFQIQINSRIKLEDNLLSVLVNGVYQSLRKNFLRVLLSNAKWDCLFLSLNPEPSNCIVELLEGI